MQLTWHDLVVRLPGVIIDVPIIPYCYTVMPDIVDGILTQAPELKACGRVVSGDGGDDYLPSAADAYHYRYHPAQPTTPLCCVNRCDPPYHYHDAATGIDSVEILDVYSYRRVPSPFFLTFAHYHSGIITLDPNIGIKYDDNALCWCEMTW